MSTSKPGAVPMQTYEVRIRPVVSHISLLHNRSVRGMAHGFRPHRIILTPMNTVSIMFARHMFPQQDIHVLHPLTEFSAPSDIWRDALETSTEWHHWEELWQVHKIRIHKRGEAENIHPRSDAHGKPTLHVWHTEALEHRMAALLPDISWWQKKVHAWHAWMSSSSKRKPVDRWTFSVLILLLSFLQSQATAMGRMVRPDVIFVAPEEVLWQLPNRSTKLIHLKLDMPRSEPEKKVTEEEKRLHVRDWPFMYEWMQVPWQPGSRHSRFLTWQYGLTWLWEGNPIATLYNHDDAKLESALDVIRKEQRKIHAHHMYLIDNSTMPAIPRPSEDRRDACYRVYRQVDTGMKHMWDSMETTVFVAFPPQKKQLIYEWWLQYTHGFFQDTWRSWSCSWRNRPCDAFLHMNKGDQRCLPLRELRIHLWEKPRNTDTTASRKQQDQAGNTLLYEELKQDRRVMLQIDANPPEDANYYRLPDPSIIIWDETKILLKHCLSWWKRKSTLFTNSNVERTNVWRGDLPALQRCLEACPWTHTPEKLARILPNLQMLDVAPESKDPPISLSQVATRMKTSTTEASVWLVYLVVNARLWSWYPTDTVLETPFVDAEQLWFLTASPETIEYQQTFRDWWNNPNNIVSPPDMTTHLCVGSMEIQWSTMLKKEIPREWSSALAYVLEHIQWQPSERVTYLSQLMYTHQHADLNQWCHAVDHGMRCQWNQENDLAPISQEWRAFFQSKFRMHHGSRTGSDLLQALKNKDLDRFVFGLIRYRCLQERGIRFEWDTAMEQAWTKEYSQHHRLACHAVSERVQAYHAFRPVRPWTSLKATGNYAIYSEYDPTVIVGYVDQIDAEEETIRSAGDPTDDYSLQLLLEHDWIDKNLSDHTKLSNTVTQAKLDYIQKGHWLPRLQQWTPRAAHALWQILDSSSGTLIQPALVVLTGSPSSSSSSPVSKGSGIMGTFVAMPVATGLPPALPPRPTAANVKKLAAAKLSATTAATEVKGAVAVVDAHKDAIPLTPVDADAAAVVDAAVDADSLPAANLEAKHDGNSDEETPDENVALTSHEDPEIKVNTAAPAAAPATPAAAPVPAVAPTDEKWECASCTFTNAMSNKVCEMCGSAKPIENGV
jgi:hypothetical protein